MSTTLLDEDGTASMATVLMLSHHAFRRDIARLIRAVAEIKAGDLSRVTEVRAEWESSYRQALHGHHTSEEHGIFPDVKANHPELGPALDTLTSQHHMIDPLIERGDAAFADLAHPEHAEVVLTELKKLLDIHLAYEETEITPFLRSKKEFPMPSDEASLAMYAGGFSWSMQGIAPEVVSEVKKLLPEALVAKLPQAQEEFELRSKRAWGTHARTASNTSVPEDYTI